MLKVYNTLSRKKEELKPFAEAQAFGSEAQARRGKKLKLFVCGPTVYDFSHIGHARTYVAFDMIVKYLRQAGYEVFYLQNITDIDDKIIARAKESGATPEELALKFEEEYMKDMDALKVNGVTKYARATEHIPEIISQVQTLLKKDFAYRIEDGVYYDISKFNDYGKLSGRTALQAEDGVSKIDENKEKKNKGDFCLWKLSKPREPSWPSPFGKGRPGWHIEDTAITERYFGAQYDIHGGGRDLLFPHHEAEIAQMEAISGKKPLVLFWMHTGFLTISGQKMSKSLSNFITIKDFLKEHSARELRFFVLKTHYRSPIDYSETEIENVKNQMKRIDEFVDKLKNVRTSVSVKNEKKIDSLIAKTENNFCNAMNDDFNTPNAFASLFEFVGEINSLMDKNKIDPNDVFDILVFLKKLDKFLDFDLGRGIPLAWRLSAGGKINLPENSNAKISASELPKEILDLIEKREQYRKDGLWQKADQMREKIEKKGYKVKDAKEGPQILKIKQ